MFSIPKFNPSKRNVILAASFVVIVAGVITFAVFSSNSNASPAMKQQIANLQSAVNQNPHDADSRVSLALAYYQAGNVNRAISELQTAIKLNPTHQGATLLLADIYMEKKRYNDAVPYYIKVIEASGNSPMHGISRELEGAYYQLGNAYIHLGKTADAIKAFESALNIDASDADAWYLLATGFQAMGQYDKAIEAFKESVRFVPNFKEAYQGLAECYDKSGQNVYAAYARAMIAYSSGSMQDALTQLKAVVAQKSDIHEVYLGMGLVYEELGQKDDAKQAYQKTLALDPENWLAKSKLGQ